MLQELNAFASQQLDIELEEEAAPAYGDAFAARPGVLLPFHLSATPLQTFHIRATSMLCSLSGPSTMLYW